MLELSEVQNHAADCFPGESLKRMDLEEWEAFRLRSPALARRFARLHPDRVPKPPPPRKRIVDRRPARAARRWSKEDDRILRALWGDWTLSRLAAELDRSPRAITSRAEFLELGPASSRGMSMRQFEKFSGFSKTRILNAARALRIKIPRAKSGRLRRTGGRKWVRQKSKLYSIDDELAIRLIDEMMKPGFIGRSKRWGEQGRPPACVTCGETRRKHKAKGQCSRCYGNEHQRKARKAKKKG